MADGAKEIFVPLNLHDNEILGVSGINGGTSEDVVMGDGSFGTIPDVPTSLADLSSDPQHRTITDAERIEWNSKYKKPDGGIPKTDLTLSVRRTLDKADTAVQHNEISGFVTRSVNDLLNYYLKSETYTKEEVQQLLASIEGLSLVYVDHLPTASADTLRKIYLVPSSDPEAQNIKEEYITLDNGAQAATRYTWELIGSTAIDLSGVVRYNTTQSLTDAQKTQARENIGAAGFIAWEIGGNYTTSDAFKVFDVIAAGGVVIGYKDTNGFYQSYSFAGMDTRLNFVFVREDNGIVYEARCSYLYGGWYYNEYSINDTIKYSSQTLTDAQKTQARTNIGAGTYSKPSGGIPATDLSASVQTILNNAAFVESGTTSYWDAQIGYVPDAGTIIIYTDKETVNGTVVPGIKIGSGNAYVQDLAFVGDDIAAALRTHINDVVRHVTAEERTYWNHKIDIDEVSGEVHNETLKLIR